MNLSFIVSTLNIKIPNYLNIRMVTSSKKPASWHAAEGEEGVEVSQVRKMSANNIQQD